METKLKIHKIIARDIPDLWFQAVHDILENGRSFIVDKGSYAGQTRLEYDYFTGHILDPSYGSGTQEILPHIPSSFGIPDPVEFEYVYGGGSHERSYIEYLMTAIKQPNESYTYGERLTAAKISHEDILYRESNSFDKEIMHKFLMSHESEKRYPVFFKKNINKYDTNWYDSYHIDQIEWIIEAYKNYGFRNNQLILQIAQPTDHILVDPPCLRHIDTRIQDGYLHFFIYFRSWDLWGGLPANLAGIEALHKYMSGQIGVKQGEFIIESKGLHLYGYAEDLAKKRCIV